MSRTRALLVSLALLAAVVGLSAGVGFAARGSGFAWAVASTFGTALGTTLLALATGALAYSTWRDVRASQLIAKHARDQAQAMLRSTELAEEQREEQLRPVLIGSVTALGTDDEGDYASVELHNIGGGAAVRIEATVQYANPAVRAKPTVLPWIPPGGKFPVAIRLTKIPWALRSSLNPMWFRTRGRYLDRLARPVELEIIDWKHDELRP